MATPAFPVTISPAPSIRAVSPLTQCGPNSLQQGRGRWARDSLPADTHLQGQSLNTELGCFQPTLDGTTTLKSSHWGFCDLYPPPAQGHPGGRTPRTLLHSATLERAVQLPVALGGRKRHKCVDEDNLRAA